MIVFTSVPHRVWAVPEMTEHSGGCWGGDAEERCAMAGCPVWPSLCLVHTGRCRDGDSRVAGT